MERLHVGVFYLGLLVTNHWTWWHTIWIMFVLSLIAMVISSRRLLVAIALLCGACAHHKQFSDPNFSAIVEKPAFRGDGPKILFDDGHKNFHRSDGRYTPFVTLVRNDGFIVESNTKSFDRESLRPYGILVIANAEGETAAASAFTAAEVDAVGAWVEDGGSLLLIADHTPFGQAANSLSERFGVSMLDHHLKDENHHDPLGAYFLLFTTENGLLADHPITRGLKRVVTFGGQALRVHSPADILLRVSPDARIVQDPKQPSNSEPVGPDAANAVALKRGRGRVVIVGEAAALTAQVITGDPAKAFGVKELRIGMSREDIDNKQFALNIVRWLAGKL